MKNTNNLIDLTDINNTSNIGSGINFDEGLMSDDDTILIGSSDLEFYSDIGEQVLSINTSQGDLNQPIVINSDSELDSDFFIDDAGDEVINIPTKNKLKIGKVKEILIDSDGKSDGELEEIFIPRVIHSTPNQPNIKPNSNKKSHLRSGKDEDLILSKSGVSSSSNNRVKGQFRNKKSKERYREEEELIQDYLDCISDTDKPFNMTKLSHSLSNQDSDDSVFDIDDNWSLFQIKSKSKFKNNTNAYISPTVKQLRVYHNLFTNFIMQEDIHSIPLAPMKDSIRVKVVHLTKLYNLKCNLKKGGRKKFLTISKTRNADYIEEETFINFCKSYDPAPKINLDIASSEKKLKKLKLEINQKLNDKNNGNNSNNKGKRSKNGKKPNKGSNSSNPGNSDPLPQSEPAKPIDEGNKGHKLLSKLGWTPGTSIGANNTGILDPIEAHKMKGRSGLGFN